MLPVLQLTLNIAEEAGTQALPNSGGTIGSLITGLLTAVMAIAMLLLLFFLIWAAIEWVSAGGDSSKIQKARDKITQGVIGVLVLAASLAIFFVIQTFLGVQVLNLGSITGVGSGATNNYPGLPRASIGGGHCPGELIFVKDFNGGSCLGQDRLDFLNSQRARNPGFEPIVPVDLRTQN